MAKIWTEEDILNVIKGEGFTDFQATLAYEECGFDKYEDEEEGDDDDFAADIVEEVMSWWEVQEIMEE